MNKKKVKEIVNIGLSGYEFAELHRQKLLAELNKEKHASKKMSSILISIGLFLAVAVMALFIWNSCFS